MHAVTPLFFLGTSSSCAKCSRMLPAAVNHIPWVLLSGAEVCLEAEGGGTPFPCAGL